VVPTIPRSHLAAPAWDGWGTRLGGGARRKAEADSLREWQPKRQQQQQRQPQVPRLRFASLGM